MIKSIILTGLALLFVSFAMAQSRQEKRKNRVPVRTYETSLVVDAPVELSWKVISDAHNYAAYSPDLDSSPILEGEGLGAVRACSSGGDSWTEVCTAWEPLQYYQFQVNTNVPDYPFPLQFLQGTWEVEPIGPDKSRIIMRFDAQMNSRFMDFIGRGKLMKQAERGCKPILENWQAEILRRKAGV